jgi:hypothetical protein
VCYLRVERLRDEVIPGILKKCIVFYFVPRVVVGTPMSASDLMKFPRRKIKTYITTVPNFPAVIARI